MWTICPANWLKILDGIHLAKYFFRNAWPPVIHLKLVELQIMLRRAQRRRRRNWPQIWKNKQGMSGMSQIGTSDEQQTINRKKNIKNMRNCVNGITCKLLWYFWTVYLLRHLHVGFLTAFVGNAFVSSVNVHTGLSVSALMSSCLTFIYV